MTREGIKNIKGALKIISEQCKATISCENCPLFDCCQSDVGVFEICPSHWSQEVFK